jgi:hypothetical protein
MRLLIRCLLIEIKLRGDERCNARRNFRREPARGIRVRAQQWRRIGSARPPVLIAIPGRVAVNPALNPKPGVRA